MNSNLFHVFFPLDWMYIVYPAFQRSSSFHFDLPPSLTHSLMINTRVYSNRTYTHIQKSRSDKVWIVCAFFSFFFFFFFFSSLHIYIISLWQCIVRAWYGSVPRFKIITNDATYSILYTLYNLYNFHTYKEIENGIEWNGMKRNGTTTTTISATVYSNCSSNNYTGK